MKVSLWDILSTILFAAWLVMSAAFLIIYRDPASQFNPFPPRTQAAITYEAEFTTTQVVLPDIWTPLPEEEDAGIESDEDYELVEGLDIEEEESSGIPTNTPVLIITPRSSSSATGQTPVQRNYGVILPTKSPLDAVSPVDEEDQALTVIAPVGVFDNTWQNIQSIPIFSWTYSGSVQDIDHFQLYFGTKQNGKLTIRTAKMNYSWKAVKSGIYYLRLVAVGKTGKILGKPAYFLFKFDNTPPSDPDGFVTISEGDTAYPYFEWAESTDANSGMNGGYAGYSIYQGLEKKCGKAVAFTADTHWTPVTPVDTGTTQYFCVRAYDAVGNFSKWVGPVAYTRSN